MIIVFWTSFNHTTNPETAVICTHGHLNQVVFAVFHDTLLLLPLCDVLSLDFTSSPCVCFNY